MYAHILVPLDGSPLSERALRYAIPLAEQHGARVHLLHVATPVLPLITGGGAPVRDAGLDAHWLAEDRKAVERIAKRAKRHSAVQVDLAFRTGRPSAEIVRYSKDNDIGLIVMCSHGRGGFERLWLGSVADELLRELPAPVLLVRGGRGLAVPEAGAVLFPRILIPLDGSPQAERAIAATTELLGATPTAITLLSVLHPTATMGATTTPAPAEVERCAAYLEPLAARERRAARSVEVGTVVAAAIPRAIITYARQHDASLIAITTRGMSGVKRAVVGSVADKLLRSAPMPVLAVP